MAEFRSAVEMKCLICSRPFINGLKPRNLFCGHTFCGECCLNMKNETIIICPLCKKETACDDVENLGINYPLLSHFETSTQQNLTVPVQNEISSNIKCDNPEINCQVSATVHCEKCDMYFCTECGKALHSNVMMRLHPLMNIADMVPKCKIHTDALEFYCDETKSLVCVKCHLLSDDKGRELRSVEVVAQENREALEQTLAKTEHLNKQLTTRSAELKRDQTNVKANSTKSMKQVVQTIETMQRQLEQRKLELQDEINQIQEEKLARCAEMLVDVERANSQVLTVRDEAIQALAQKPYALLGVSESINTNFKAAQSTTSEVLKPPRVDSSMKFTPTRQATLEINIKKLGVIGTPETPSHFTVVINESMEVSWDAVKFSSPITAYRLEMKRTQQQAADIDPPSKTKKAEGGWTFREIYSDVENQFAVKSFEPNCKYTFRVRAESEVGVSQWSEEVSYDSPKHPGVVTDARDKAETEKEAAVKEAVKEARDKAEAEKVTAVKEALDKAEAEKGAAVKEARDKAAAEKEAALLEAARKKQAEEKAAADARAAEARKPKKPACSECRHEFCGVVDFVGCGDVVRFGFRDRFWGHFCCKCCTLVKPLH